MQRSVHTKELYILLLLHMQAGALPFAAETQIPAPQGVRFW